MTDKQWTTYTMKVDGLDREVRFTDEAVNNVFLPFIKKLNELHARIGRRVVAYLAAPPAAGKTVVAQFIEKLSRERAEYTNIRALGVEGFLYSNTYMDAHFAVVDGSTIPMKMIKGAPETYDVDTMQDKIREVRLGGAYWPVYDRGIDDIVPDMDEVDDEIILIEGRYLLLRNAKWTNIRVLADYTVYIEGEVDDLRRRRMEEVVPHEGINDGRNMELVINTSGASSETWTLTSDGDYIRSTTDVD